MRTANGVSAVMIIYRAKDPGQIFIEIKDDGHPIKYARRKLCCIGGNWIGDGAKDDRSPLDTARREVSEELSFERPMRSMLELAQLGVADEALMAPTPQNNVFIPESDRKILEQLKEQIRDAAKPCGMTFNETGEKVLIAADPGWKRGSLSGLSCYFEVGLPEYWWDVLTYLQQKYGNISNESITLITSVDKIIATGQKTFAHDHALRRFFLSKGVTQAKNLPIVENTMSEVIGSVPESYDELQKEWNILKKPVTSPVTS